MNVTQTCLSILVLHNIIRCSVCIERVLNVCSNPPRCIPPYYILITSPLLLNMPHPLPTTHPSVAVHHLEGGAHRHSDSLPLQRYVTLCCNSCFMMINRCACKVTIGLIICAYQGTKGLITHTRGLTSMHTKGLCAALL